MPDAPLRCLIVESEPPHSRAKRRHSVGQSSGETYADVLRAIAPFECDEARPADGNGASHPPLSLDAYDAVFVTGSPLHLYRETPETRRQVEFMRAVFAAGTPAFGSCAGLQVATVAAGGAVRLGARGREPGFARRLTPTAAGRAHPLLAGRPDAFDAPTMHTDEVESLPDGASLLATNPVTAVQAAEIRHGAGHFWGVQYHPELSLAEIAAALRRQSDELVREGFAAAEADVEVQAGLIEALGEAPDRRDLAWRLGLDEEVTDPRRRVRELRNFVEHLVKPTRSARGRG